MTAALLATRVPVGRWCHLFFVNVESVQTIIRQTAHIYVETKRRIGRFLSQTDAPSDFTFFLHRNIYARQIKVQIDRREAVHV